MNGTSRIRTLMGACLATLVLALWGGANAEATIGQVIPSTQWENSWEGDESPAANGWSDFDAGYGGGIGDFTLMTEGSDDFIRFSTDVGFAGIDRTLPSLDPKTNGGMALEYRFRTGPGVTILDVGTSDVNGQDNRFIRFYNQPAEVDHQVLPDPQCCEVEIAQTPTWTTLLLYATETTIQVFKDGDLGTPVLDYTAPLPANDPRLDGYLRILSGQTHADPPQVLDIDHLRWTDAPIPEPATLGVLAAGSMLSILRRRRR